MFLFAEFQSSNLLSLLFSPQSNIINWLILIAALWWLGLKYLPSVFAARKASIENELKAASEAKERTLAQLQEQKQKVASADKEAEQILAEAKQAAEGMRIEIDKQTESEVADLLKKFQSTLANERQTAIQAMRAVAIRAAIKLTEENLRSTLTEQARAKLLSQFVEQLDSIADGQKLNSPEQFEKIH